MSTENETYTLRIPRQFFIDHVDRGCMEDTDKDYSDYIVRRTKRHFIVELSEADVRELWSDSHHYAVSGCDVYGFDFGWLISSARATCRAIERQAAAALLSESHPV